jgi:hypothetical protein
MDRVKTILEGYATRFSLPYQERLELEDRIELTIYDLLKDWAESIPEDILELYGPHLVEVRAFCISRKPTYCRIYNVLNKISVIYGPGTFVDVYITITPTNVLVSNNYSSIQEKVFPLTWNNDPVLLTSYKTKEEKLSVYNTFLESNYKSYLIIITQDLEDVSQLLEQRTPTPVTIQSMIEGKPTQMLDTDLRPIHMYDDPFPIKHIIHRKSFDSFARTILALEGTQTTVVEFCT